MFKLVTIGYLIMAKDQNFFNLIKSLQDFSAAFGEILVALCSSKTMYNLYNNFSIWKYISYIY